MLMPLNIVFTLILFILPIQAIASGEAVTPNFSQTAQVVAGVDSSGAIKLLKLNPDGTLIAQESISPLAYSSLGVANAQVIKPDSGNVVALSALNQNSSSRYLLLHDQVTPPETGQTPKFSFLLPSGAQVVVGTDFSARAVLHLAKALAFVSHWPNGFAHQPMPTMPRFILIITETMMNWIYAMITSAVLLLISMFSSASTVIHDTASASSSTPIIEPMISSTSIVLSDKYELVEQHGKSYLTLKRFSDFSKLSRPVGLADNEYGWSWLNRSTMTQADEGQTTPNVLSIQHGPAVTIWGTSGQDGVFRYKTYKTTWYDYQEWVARIKSNADEKNETASLLIASVNSYGDYHRIGLGNYNNGPAVIYNLVGSHKYTNITQEEFDRGIWVRIVRHGNMSTAYYSLADQDTPPKEWPNSWIEAQSGTFTSGSTMTDVKAGFMIHSGTSTAGDLIGQFLYYDDSQALSSPYDGQSTTWAAQGYADDNPEVSLLKDFDLGSNGLTINIDQFKAVLQSTVNLWMHNSAVWTFSLVQSETPNANSGTFNPIESLNLEGSGPYLSLWAKCQSNGFQSGSIALPMSIPLVSQ